VPDAAGNEIADALRQVADEQIAETRCQSELCSRRGNNSS
jgi:hypothetical protein